MTLRISGKNMEIGDAFRSRIQSAIENAIEKYFDGGFAGHVVVAKTGAGYNSDCTVHLDSGLTLQAAGKAMEPIAAFDMAAEHFEKRMRRYKRKLKSHANGSDNGFDVTDIAYSVMAPLADDDEEIPEDYAPAIVAESTVALKTMTVALAVMELDMKESPVVVFRNAGNESVNVVYRRPDGNIGWIDPSTVKANS